MEKDMLKLNIQKISKLSENYLIPTKNVLPGIIEKYKKKASTKNEKKKVELIENYLKQMISIEKIMNKWKLDLENLK